MDIASFGAIVFSFVIVVILVIAFNPPNRKENHVPVSERPTAEDIAEAAAKRHPRSPVAWEPAVRPEPPHGWRERSVADVDPAAWDHARHYNSYYGS